MKRSVDSNASKKVSRKRLRKLGSFSSSILRTIKRDVDSGEYRRTLMESGFSFEKSELGAGFVDKVYPDYSKITGRVINGEFIPLKLHKN